MMFETAQINFLGDVFAAVAVAIAVVIALIGSLFTTNVNANPYLKTVKLLCTAT